MYRFPATPKLTFVKPVRSLVSFSSDWLPAKDEVTARKTIINDKIILLFIVSRFNKFNEILLKDLFLGKRLHKTVKNIS
jgi:hypothetical protein